MSIEALWYSMYSESGAAPHCTRLSRIPMQQQWEAAIDLAISFTRGEAGYRQTYLALTREQYWYWLNPLSPSGWWLIPDRVAKRAFQLHRDAALQACRRTGSAGMEDIERVLLGWKNTGTWRRHAQRITPRRKTIKPVIPLKRRKGRPVDIEAIRTRAAELRAKLFGRPVYTRAAARALAIPAGWEMVECDNGHLWLVPAVQPHDAALDVCPKCGEYWV